MRCYPPRYAPRFAARLGKVFRSLVAIALLAVSGWASNVRAEGSDGPLELGAAHLGANLVVLPSGAWEAYSIRSSGGISELIRRRSDDDGQTWRPSEVLRRLPIAGGVVALLDRGGEVQLFALVARKHNAGQRIAIDRFIDLWQLRSSAGRTIWSDPQKIFSGYIGSLQGALQLRSGRIIVPFATAVPALREGPPTGSSVTTLVYSDDGGRSWLQSPANLKAPCEDTYNGSNYGAIEPTVLELKDGRVWMLMRTQTGYLYESYSNDGVVWSEARPSRFHSSNSPAFLLRLSDDSIVLLWNNCEPPDRVDGQGVYGGRDALHAAISADEGLTWFGFREVYLDGRRNDSPPHSGDRGTAYPFAVVAKGGRIAVISGQGSGRRQLELLDSAWLWQRVANDDFSHGLQTWSVFKAFGPAHHWWRDRVSGARLVDDPARSNVKLLNLGRPDDRPADGAVWNFPSGRKGTLTLRVKLNEGFAGAHVALLDRFFDPTDERVPSQAAFVLPIDAQGTLEQKSRLAFAQWHTLALAWDLDAGQCRVRVDNRAALTLPLKRAVRNGVSYLHLRSDAARVDAAGLMVESVGVTIDDEALLGRRAISKREGKRTLATHMSHRRSAVAPTTKS